MQVGLGNVPFSSSDNHRYYQMSGQFSAKVTLKNCRMIHTNVLRINTNDDITFSNIINYGYGYYQLESKRYYFFITNYEYVNDNVTDITISVDWFSTDFGSNVTESDLKISFVQRMHPEDSKSTDYPQLPESISFGDKQYITKATFNPANSFEYVIGVTHCIPNFEMNSNWYDYDAPFVCVTDCTFLSGVPTGVLYYVLPNLKQCNYVYQNATNLGYSSSILGVWAVPSGVLDNYKTSKELYYYANANDRNTDKRSNFSINCISNTNSMQLYDTITFEKPNGTINDYTYTYAKCLYQDYCTYFMASNSTVVEYNPKLMTVYDNAVFEILLTIDPNMTALTYPKYYSGNPTEYLEGITIQLSMSGSLTADSTSRDVKEYMCDLAKNAVTGTAGLIETGLGTYQSASASTKTAEKATAITALAVGETFVNDFMNQTIKGLETTFTMGKTVARVTGSGQTSCSMTLPNGNKGFRYGYCCLQKSDFQKIDRYFSMMGYRYDSAITPVIRQTYSYIQGEIDFDSTTISDVSRNYIKNLFRNGVTIWRGTPMYNYDVRDDTTENN